MTKFLATSDNFLTITLQNDKPPLETQLESRTN